MANDWSMFENLGIAPTDLLQVLYPYATFQPTLDFQRQQQEAMFGFERGQQQSALAAQSQMQKANLAAQLQMAEKEAQS